MRTALFTFLLIVLYMLHQDLWFWRAARPLVFGFLPLGLFYHAMYTLVCAACFWAMVVWIWPAHLEKESSSDTVSGEQAR